MSDIDLEEWLEQRELSAYRACKEGHEIPSMSLYDKVARLRKRIEKLEAENEKLRDGLEFYADEEHLETGDRGGSVPKDFGRKAKQILKEVYDE